MRRTGKLSTVLSIPGHTAAPGTKVFALLPNAQKLRKPNMFCQTQLHTQKHLNGIQRA